MEKSVNSELSEDVPKRSVENIELTGQEVKNNIKTLEKLWEYRYVCLVDEALKTNNWFKLFALLA